MFKTSLAWIVVAAVLPVPAMAGSPVAAGDAYQAASRATVLKKSKRQKCLDMMLPQDGVDCLKKLKAKKKRK